MQNAIAIRTRDFAQSGESGSVFRMRLGAGEARARAHAKARREKLRGSRRTAAREFESTALTCAAGNAIEIRTRVSLRVAHQGRAFACGSERVRRARIHMPRPGGGIR